MFSGKTSCGVTINVLQRTPVFTDGTFLIMLIGHPNYQGYPVCKGIGLFTVVGCMCCVVCCYCLLLCVVMCCLFCVFVVLLNITVSCAFVCSEFYCWLLYAVIVVVPFLFVVIVCCCCLLLCVCLLSVLLYGYTIIDFAIFSTIQPLLFHRGGKVCQRREFD